MGEVEARRRAAWRFVRAVVRSQAGGVVGAVLSGLLWQTGAISAPLIVSYTIDHGIVPRDRHTLVVWLLALLPLPLGSVVAWVYSRRYDERTRRLQEAWASAATLVEEMVSGIRVVKGLGAGAALSDRFRSRSDEIVGRALEVARLDAVFNPALEVLPLIGIAVVLWVGGRQVISGSLSL